MARDATSGPMGWVWLVLKSGQDRIQPGQAAARNDALVLVLTAQGDAKDSIFACAASVALVGAWIWAGANVAAYLSTGP